MAAFSLHPIDQPLIMCFGTSDATAIHYGSSEKTGFSNNDPFLSNKCGDESTVSMVEESYYKVEFGEQVTQRRVKNIMENKRGNGVGSSQSMGGNEVKSKRQKKSTSVRKEEKEKKVKKAHEKKDEKKISSEEAPTEYVHVRARRGQATDSHSLAERARREKIRGKMKILQGLVPGCDKVTGKALMLDEIINYVQSLQNQVEFLSMKSASLNSAFFEFGTESDNLIMTPEVLRLNAEPPIISDTFTGLTTQADIYPLLDHATSSLLFGPQIQRPYTLTQDDGQALWDVTLDRQGQIFNNELGFMTNNLCSFH